MLGPFATASRFTLSFTRCRYCRHFRTPPARCPRRRRRQRQRVTEGTAMAPWNGPKEKNKKTLITFTKFQKEETLCGKRNKQGGTQGHTLKLAKHRTDKNLRPSFFFQWTSCEDMESTWPPGYCWNIIPELLLQSFSKIEIQEEWAFHGLQYVEPFGSIKCSSSTRYCTTCIMM